MANTYEVKRNEIMVGTFVSREIKNMASTGALKPDDLIRKVGTDKWVRAGKVKSLNLEIQTQTISDEIKEISTESSPSPKTQALEETQKSVAGSNVTENINEDADLIEEEVTEQGPLTSGSLLLRLLGGLCIAVGVVDFITANTGMYDVYAGVPFVYQIGIGNFSLGFFTVIILCGIGGYLCRAGKNAVGNVTQDQKIMGWIGGSWLFILAFTNVGPLTGLGGDPMFNSEAYMVKNGSLYDCPNRTVGDMANSFMASPQWETILGDDGNTYVNLTGGIMVDNRDTTAVIQFKVTQDEFALEAVEYNGVPQEAYEANSLLDIMCSTY